MTATNQLHNLIANGGKILVVGGYNKSWPEYRNHPQIEFWSGDNKDQVRKHIQNRQVPTNLRAVIMSRFISHSEAGVMMREARKRNALILSPLSDGQITKALQEITYVEPKPFVAPEPVKTVEVVSISNRTGQVTKEVSINTETNEVTVMSEYDFKVKGTLISFIRSNFDKFPGDRKKLFDEAVKQGYKGNWANFVVAINYYLKNKDKAPVTRVKKVKPEQTEQKKSEVKGLLELIDDTILNMKLIRDEVKKLQGNEHMRDKLRKFLESI